MRCKTPYAAHTKICSPSSRTSGKNHRATAVSLGMGYLFYYLLVFGAGYALRYPYLAAAAVLVYFGRRWLPDPYLYFKHAGRVRALKAQISQNPDNATA